MTITFRPCTPDDVEAAVPLIYSAGPAAFRYVFSQRQPEQALEFLRFAFAQDRGEFGHHRHIAVLQDDRPVGIGALYQRRQRLSDFSGVVQQIIRYYRLESWRVMQRGTIMEHVVQPPRKQVAYLANLGIDPGCRGTGIGTRLVEHLLQLGREQGYAKAGLDVADSNPDAQRLYERLGFTVQEYRPASVESEFGSLTGHYYMERNLLPAAPGH